MSKNNKESLGLIKKMMIALVTLMFLFLGAQAVRRLSNR